MMVRTLMVGVILLAACGRDVRVASDSGVADAADVSVFACTPNETSCHDRQHYRCGADGMSRAEVVDCPAGCDPSEGCVACMPDSRACDGELSLVCNADGTGFVLGRDCAESGSVCEASGFCGDACGVAELYRSSLGCEYWPTPLATKGFGDDFEFRAVVSNPNADPVNVRVFSGDTVVAEVTIPEGGLEGIALPWVGFQSGPREDEWSRIIEAGAYRLVSDRPVTVFQFNPFEYVTDVTFPDGVSGIFYSYSNDASLLLPSHSLTRNYIVSSFTPTSILQYLDPPTVSDRFPRVEQHPGYISIVGINTLPTTVEVVPTARVAADEAGRFAETEAGDTLTFTLQQGEVATLFSVDPPECVEGRPGYHEVRGEPNEGGVVIVTSTCNETTFDLTGSLVTSANPVAVFGAHECAYVPYNTAACDHLESQVPPLETWGNSYVSAPMGDVRFSAETTNVVRITAAFDDTSVSISPAQSGVEDFTLNRGESREFNATSAFTAGGSHAILVTQFLVGAEYEGADQERGDPSMIILPPREQYRDDYTFVTPSSYNSETLGQSFLFIARSPGQSILLDGAPALGSWQTIGDLEWAIIAVEGGTHRMSSDGSFGVLVYGVGSFTSYAYPAGLNLEELLIL